MSKTDNTQWVKIGTPIYHRKRQYFTMPAMGDQVHEVNLDYIEYPLIPVEPTQEGKHV